MRLLHRTRLTQAFYKGLLITSLALCFGQSTRVSAQTTLPAPGGKLPSFEVASIKPADPSSNGQDWDSTGNRIFIKNYSLRKLIGRAYGTKSDSQIVGGPEWVDKQHFDIEAKFDEADVARSKSMSSEEEARQFRLMLQALLANRFQLKITPSTESRSVYLLAPSGKGKPKLVPTQQAAQVASTDQGGAKPRAQHSWFPATLPSTSSTSTLLHNLPSIEVDCRVAAASLPA